MKRKNTKPSLSGQILNYLVEIVKMLPAPLETPYGYMRRLGRVNRPAYLQSLRRLQNKGFVQVGQKNGKKFLQITRKGQLQNLLIKAKYPKKEKWDGKWRLILFDIPESANTTRSKLRRMLIQNGFKKLQQSVYISPYRLNSEAVDYLKETGLIHFIRLLRVDKLDDPREIMKHFKLINSMK